jgi:hypothetical protein
MPNGFLNLVNRDGINYWITEDVSLLVPGAENSVLTTVGGVATWASPGSLVGVVDAVTASAPLASSGGQTPNISISSSVGTGAVVLATAPTLPSTLDVQGVFSTYPSATSGLIANFFLPALGAASQAYINVGTAVSTDNSAVLIYNNNATIADRFLSLAFAGRSDGIRIYQDQRVVLPGTLAVTGTTTLLGTTILSNLTASRALALDASKNVVSIPNTGTGNNVLSDAPTFTGLITAADLSVNAFSTAAGSTLNGAVTINNTLLVTGVFRSLVNVATYSMSGNSAWPDTTPTPAANWVTDFTRGETLTLSGGQTWINNLGRDIYVTFTWTGKRASNGLGANTYFLQAAGVTYAQTNNVGVDAANLSATIPLQSAQAIQVIGIQLSGSGNNFLATNAKVTLVIQH